MNLTEIWVGVPGYENRYSISSLGRILNKKTGNIRGEKRDSKGYCTLKIVTRKRVH